MLRYTAIEIEAGSEQVTIAGCLFYANSEGTDEFLECIDTSGGAASDRLTVIGCHFAMGAGSANSAICMKDSDYATIVDNVIYGDYAVACINQVTTASNHILIEGNTLFEGTIGGTAGLNAQPCIELLATTTGVIRNNALICDAATANAAVVGADMFLVDNDYTETEAVAALPVWVSDQDLDHLMETAVADTSDPVDMTAEVPDDTVIANIMDDGGDTSAYDRREDSLVAISDKVDGTTTIAGRTYASVMTATSQNDDLFDVDGGAILITSFTGVVTTEIGAVGNTIAIVLDADAGFIDSDFSTAVETNGDVVGTRYLFSNVTESVLTPVSDTAGNTNPMESWFCGEGMIEQAASGSTTGAIKWYMTWIPFADGTTVTAQ